MQSHHRMLFSPLSPVMIYKLFNHPVMISKLFNHPVMISKLFNLPDALQQEALTSFHYAYHKCFQIHLLLVINVI